MIYNPAPIDEQLISDLRAYEPGLGEIQNAGFVKQVFDPSIRKVIMACQPDQDNIVRPFTIDSVNYDVQLGHNLTGGVPIQPEQRWGSRSENRYNLQLTLLVATRRDDLLPIILQSLSEVQDLQVTEFFANTLAVLQREFLFIPSPERPYDPRLCAYAIRYTRINSALISG